MRKWVFFYFYFSSFSFMLGILCAQKPTISWLMAYRMFAVLRQMQNSIKFVHNERTQCARIQDGEFDCCEMTTNFSRARAAETMRWINCGILNSRRRIEWVGFVRMQANTSLANGQMATNKLNRTNEWMNTLFLIPRNDACMLRSLACFSEWKEIRKGTNMKMRAYNGERNGEHFFHPYTPTLRSYTNARNHKHFATRALIRRRNDNDDGGGGNDNVAKGESTPHWGNGKEAEKALTMRQNSAQASAREPKQRI